MSSQPDYEAQLGAMRAVMEALEPLDNIARQAVFTWVGSQLGIKAPSVGVPSSVEGGPPKQNGSKREGTVSVVAQKIGVKSARDLLFTAAVHLTLYQDKDSFTKDDLVSCAKEARGWKVAYSSQMALNIKRMSDAGVLFEKARDVFSLSDTALADAEGRLAS